MPLLPGDPSRPSVPGFPVSPFAPRGPTGPEIPSDPGSPSRPVENIKGSFMVKYQNKSVSQTTLHLSLRRAFAYEKNSHSNKGDATLALISTWNLELTC